MAIMRRVLSVILSIVICLLSLASVAYADTAIEDVNKMAGALNKLNILQGSNGNYLLANNIIRAEATALIIRMLGKENYVKQNTEQLKFTKYLDVKSSAWYAPYVGYSDRQSIVAGNPDGSFAPAENVSEKAFIKMVLCALGYEYGNDFNWTNVYQKAYEVGIVTDPVYINKTQDNTDYKRRDAAKVIFKSLNTSKKGTQTKMAYTLVDEGIFTAEMLYSSGVFGDDKATKVTLSHALTTNSIELKLSEKIQGIDIKDVEIRMWDVGEKVLEAKSLAFKDDTVQIITAGQMPGKAYNIKIKKVSDINGNLSSDLTGTFIGYIAEQVSSDLFKIQKVEQKSVNVINVYFTHPISINSETAAYYELYEDGNLLLSGSSQNMTVRKLQSNNSAISIYLINKALVIGQMYTLRVSGKLTSSYGVKLADGYGEIRDFTAAIDQSGQLQVISMQAMTNLSVKLLFSREIDSDWAAKRLNYTVYDPNKNVIDVTKAVVNMAGDSAGREVLLTLAGSLDRAKQYDLKLEYIPDVYKQSVIENKTVQFSGAFPGYSDLSIIGVRAEYNNVVVVNFNKPLDSTAASSRNNYVIGGMTDTTYNVTPEKVYYQESDGAYEVKLFLPPGKTLSSSYRYMVYASNIADSLGSTRSALLRYEFFAGNNAAIKPQITDAVIISNDTIKLSFNMEVSFSQTNLNASNYVLEHEEDNETFKMSPIGVTYIDAKTLVLRVDELNPIKMYKLRFNKISDYSELYTSTISDLDKAVEVRWGK